MVLANVQGCCTEYSVAAQSFSATRDATVQQNRTLLAKVVIRVQYITRLVRKTSSSFTIVSPLLFNFILM